MPLPGILAGIGSIFGGVSSAGQAIGNFNLQKEQLAYQKKMQLRQWSREDNAVQRRVDDLRKAGLSPVLAAGSAAQSSPAQVLQAPQISGVEQLGEGVSRGLQTMLALNQAEAVIGRTDAERDLLKMQARKADAEASLVEAQVPYRETLAESGATSAFSRAKLDEIAANIEEVVLHTRPDGSPVTVFGSGYPDISESASVRRRLAESSREIAHAFLTGQEARAYNILKGIGAGNQTVQTILEIVKLFMGRR